MVFYVVVVVVGVVVVFFGVFVYDLCVGGFGLFVVCVVVFYDYVGYLCFVFVGFGWC